MTVVGANGVASVLTLIAAAPRSCAEIAEAAGVCKSYAALCVRDLKNRGWAKLHRVERGVIVRDGPRGRQRMGRREYVVATEEGKAAIAADPRLASLRFDAAGKRGGWPKPVDMGRERELYQGRLYPNDRRGPFR